MTQRRKYFEYEGKKITPCQVKILLACAKGMTIKQTAEKICISEHTVKTHRENICRLFSLKGHNTLLCFAVKALPELEKWGK